MVIRQIQLSAYDERMSYGDYKPLEHTVHVQTLTTRIAMTAITNSCIRLCVGHMQHSPWLRHARRLVLMTFVINLLGSFVAILHLSPGFSNTWLLFYAPESLARLALPDTILLVLLSVHIALDACMSDLLRQLPTRGAGWPWSDRLVIQGGMFMVNWVTLLQSTNRMSRWPNIRDTTLSVSKFITIISIDMVLSILGAILLWGFARRTVELQMRQFVNYRYLVVGAWAYLGYIFRQGGE